MKKMTIFLIIIFISTVLFLMFYSDNKILKPPRAKFVKTAKHRLGGPKANPNANYWEMRAYPYDDIDIKAYTRGVDQANELKQQLLKEKNIKSWEFVGPTNVGGRISDIAIA
ncbi:MAG: hypothetical protein J7K29_00340, partial [Candidatus Cloacimonetes bacterium]|nr:hypothetical protein [Candidatus Cloacimonadota bacterium]